MGADELKPGDVFVGYTIERVLGVGGMGAVYLARDPRLPRSTALKLLDRSLTSDDYVRSRFELEADHAARLDHPNIVSVFDRGHFGDQHWIAMQFVAGMDASAALRKGPMDPARAVHIITETAKALDYAHEKGVLHRDVKPANILLGEAGSGQPERVLLADFGIAKALDENQHLTKTGSMVGTMLYAAPEVFEGSQLDPRADVYSLGCTLFRLLTGKPPYPGPDPMAIMHGHVNAPIPCPSAVRDDVPRSFDDVIAAALAKNRDDRLPSCGALSAAAQRALAASPTGATDARTKHLPSPPDGSTTREPPAPLPVGIRRRRFTLIALAVLAILGVAVAVAYVRWPVAPPTQSTLPFKGLDYPIGVAVSATGDVFVADNNNNRVVKLAVGTNNQTVLPFTDLNHPTGVAVNASGDVFVTDTKNDRVLKLAVGAVTQIVLPFTGLAGPVGVAVNTAGDLFVADNNNNRVVALPSGAHAEIVLPFTGLAGPVGVAVNTAGDLYVTDTDNHRVLALPAGAASQIMLPLAGLATPTGLAVDTTTGELFVTDNMNGRVLALRAGVASQNVLPFTGLSHPIGVAVDTSGNVLVTDGNEVLALKYVR